MRRGQHLEQGTQTGISRGCCSTASELLPLQLSETEEIGEWPLSPAELGVVNGAAVINQEDKFILQTYLAKSKQLF